MIRFSPWALFYAWIFGIMFGMILYWCRSKESDLVKELQSRIEELELKLGNKTFGNDMFRELVIVTLCILLYGVYTLNRI